MDERHQKAIKILNNIIKKFEEIDESQTDFGLEQFINNSSQENFSFQEKEISFFNEIKNDVISLDEKILTDTDKEPVFEVLKNKIFTLIRKVENLDKNSSKKDYKEIFKLIEESIYKANTYRKYLKY